MASKETGFTFNIMDAAGYGYYRVWAERSYLLKLALVPIVIKFACAIAIYGLGFEENILRQGLLMLPAMFAQGWVLAQFLRTLLMEERWPIVITHQPDDKQLKQLLNRARGIVSSVLIYVLIGMMAYILRYILMEILPTESELKHLEESGALESDHQQEGLGSFLGLLAFIPMVVMIAAAIWSFRFLLLYIPYAVLMPTRSYLKALAGFMPSVKLLTLFFVCMAPAMFIATILTRIIFGITDELAENGDIIANFIMILFSVSIEITVALVTTAAFAWVMRSFLPHKKDAMNDFPKLPKLDEK